MSMKIFAISDLHLSFGSNKPMDIFGEQWNNYLEKIKEDWVNVVKDEDIVLIAGDISWAMKIDDTKEDFSFLSSLPGKIFIIKGNHDYWWNSISAVRSVLPQNVVAIQNDAFKIGDFIICGTRGWIVPEKANSGGEQDKKIYAREQIRLELTLKSAKDLQKDNEKIICMMHYPPTNSNWEESEFTKLFEKYGVSAVCYGHLHGPYVKREIIKKINNITYYLTSCDQLVNKLIEIKV